MDLSDFDLWSLSALAHRIRTCAFGGEWNPTALVLEFSGVYGWGSAGNRDARFIAAIKGAAMEVLRADAVVFDFRAMGYEWGNAIWNVLACRQPVGGPLPAALVISDRCRKGFGSCAGMVPPQFESLEEALRFVEGPARRRLAELFRLVHLDG